MDCVHIQSRLSKLCCFSFCLLLSDCALGTRCLYLQLVSKWWFIPPAVRSHVLINRDEVSDAILGPAVVRACLCMVINGTGWSLSLLLISRWQDLGSSVEHTKAGRCSFLTGNTTKSSLARTPLLPRCDPCVRYTWGIKPPREKRPTRSLSMTLIKKPALDTTVSLFSSDFNFSLIFFSLPLSVLSFQQ